MPLPSFTVTGDLFNILGVAASELATPRLTGTAKFESNVSPEEFVTWEGDLYRVSSEIARISANGVTINGAPMRLLANDPGLNVDNLQWHVEIRIKPEPGVDVTKTMKSFWFDAPADGATVDLATVIPAPGVDISGTGGGSGGGGASITVNVPAPNGTNDTAIIQSTIDSSPVGSTIQFLTGTYLLTAPIVLKPKRAYVGLGAAFAGGSTIKQKNGTNIVNSGLLVAEAWQNNAGFCDDPIRIDNLCIDGNRDNNPTSTADGIVLTNFWSNVTGCAVNEIPRHGLVLTDTTRNGTNVVVNSCSENRVLGVRFNGIGGDGIHQVSANLDSNLDGFCIHSIFQEIGGSGINFQRGAGWTFERNHLYGITVHGIMLDACFATIVRDNYVEEFGSQATAGAYYAGISVNQLNGRGSVISGNFVGCDEPSAAVGGYQYLSASAGVSQTTARVIVTDNFIVGPPTPTVKGNGLLLQLNTGGILTARTSNNDVRSVNNAGFTQSGVVEIATMTTTT